MAERLSRKTVRLMGGLPDGNLSNLEDSSRQLLSRDPDPVYALCEFSRSKREEDDEHDGAPTAKVKARAVEVADVLPSWATPGMPLHELLDRMRRDRVGDDAIPFPSARQDQDIHEQREALADWATAHDLDDAAMGRVWKAYFEGHGLGDPGSWRDADPVHAKEFLLHMAEASDGGAMAAADAKDTEMADSAYGRDEVQALGGDPAGQEDEPLTAPGPNHPARAAFSDGGRHLTAVSDGATGER